MGDPIGRLFTTKKIGQTITISDVFDKYGQPVKIDIEVSAAAKGWVRLAFTAPLSVKIDK